jgi:hypothetical protein
VGLVTVALPAGGAGHDVACDSQHPQSALGAARRSEINSFDPPLTAVRTTDPTPPFLPFFYPPIESARCRLRGRLYMDRWIDRPAISLYELLHVVVAEIHI